MSSSWQTRNRTHRAAGCDACPREIAHLTEHVSQCAVRVAAASVPPALSLNGIRCGSSVAVTVLIRIRFAAMDNGPKAPLQELDNNSSTKQGGTRQLQEFDANKLCGVSMVGLVAGLEGTGHHGVFAELSSCCTESIIFDPRANFDIAGQAVWDSFDRNSWNKFALRNTTDLRKQYAQLACNRTTRSASRRHLLLSWVASFPFGSPAQARFPSVNTFLGAMGGVAARLIFLARRPALAVPNTFQRYPGLIHDRRWTWVALDRRLSLYHKLATDLQLAYNHAATSNHVATLVQISECCDSRKVSEALSATLSMEISWHCLRSHTWNSSYLNPGVVAYFAKYEGTLYPDIGNVACNEGPAILWPNVSRRQAHSRTL